MAAGVQRTAARWGEIVRLLLCIRVAISCLALDRRNVAGSMRPNLASNPALRKGLHGVQKSCPGQKIDNPQANSIDIAIIEEEDSQASVGRFWPTRRWDRPQGADAGSGSARAAGFCNLKFPYS